MKALKKVLALCLAAMLLLALCPAAFADTVSADTATITISGAKAGETYKVYRMFDVLSVDSTDADNIQISYKVTDDWKDFFETGAGAEYIKLDNGYPTWQEGKAAADFAKAAKAYAATLTATDTKEATAEGVSFTLPLGYYFVDSTLGAVCNLTSAHQNMTIHEKNGVPTVEKKILEDDQLKEANVAAIGDTVTYQSEVTLYQGTEKVIYHDVMTKGLTFNNTSVKLNGAELPAGVEVKVTGLSDTDCTFEVVFDKAYLETLDINKTPETMDGGTLKQVTVKLTYEATINKDALVDDKDTNSAHLTFGEKGRSADSVTETSYRSFDLIKYATKSGKRTLLDGAKFSLYKDATCTPGQEINLVLVSDETDGTVYRVAAAGEAGAITEFTTQGKLITVKGLDDTIYYLKETAAPRGYNPLTTAVTVNLTNASLTAERENDFYKDLTGVQVENQSGTTLPSTGGIGTTVFYVVGGILMAGAVVLLVSKKRMEKNV